MGKGKKREKTRGEEYILGIVNPGIPDSCILGCTYTFSFTDTRDQSYIARIPWDHDKFLNCL
jgi:hypothetical protein